MIFSTLRFLSGFDVRTGAGGHRPIAPGWPDYRPSDAEIGSANRCTAPPPEEAVARLKQKRLVAQRAVNQDRRNNPGRGGNQHIITVNIGPVLPVRRCR